MNKLLTAILFLLIILELPTSVFAQSSEIYRKVGDFDSPSHDCRAHLQVSSNGGFLVLSVSKDGVTITPNINDVTAISWTQNSVLIFSVSPIYGRPGIYEFLCPKIVKANETIRTIVKARNINSAYPSGSDYFELSKLEDEKLSYFYIKDVDSKDFDKLRTKQNEHHVKLLR